MKKLNELSPKTKADYSKAATRSLVPTKKYADNYSDAAKASTGKDAKMYQDRSDKNKRDFINRVKGISRANKSVNEGFMDTIKQLVPGAKGKPAKKLQKKVKKPDNAEQVKLAAEINRKLKLIDGLMKKVGPLGGQLGRLMAFRRLPLAKMTPKGMYIALNDWYHSVEDELDYGDDSDALKKKYGRSVEDLYELWEEVGFKLSDYMWASGYDIKGIGQMAKIGFPAKKRTDSEWLKMNESVELDENFIAFDLEHEVLTHFQTKADGMKWKNHKNAPDSYYLVKTKHRLLKGDMASEGSDSLSKHLDSQPFPHKDGPHFSVHKESVNEGFMDAILGKNMKKKNSGKTEQTKISTDINRKLKLIDGLMKKVKPLGGKMTRLTSFRKTPIEKMTPKDLYRALNDWYLSIDDYLNDNPEVDKRHGSTVVKLYDVWEEVADKIQDYMWASGYNVKTNDPVDVIKRGRVMVKRKNIDYSAPKRTDPKWLKMNESVELDEVFGAIGLGFIASTLIKVAATTLMGAIIGGEIGASRKKSAGWTARPRRENSILDLISDKATLKTMQKKYPEALEMIGKNKDIIKYSKSITNTKDGPDKKQMQTLKKMIKDEFEKSGISWSDFISSVEPLVRKSVKDAKKKMDESVELDESVYDKKLAQAWKKVKSVPNIREISNSGQNHAKKLSALLKGSPDKLTFEKLELALGTYETHAYKAAEDKKNPHGKEDLPKLQEFCDSVDEVIGAMKNLHQSNLDEKVIIESVSPKQIAMLKKQYSSMPDRLPLDQAMKMSKMVAKFDKEALMKVAKADIKWISSAAKTNLISKHGATAKDFKESVSEDVPANNTGNVASHGNFPIGHEKLMRRPKLIDVTDKRYTKQTKEGKTVLKSFKSMMKK